MAALTSMVCGTPSLSSGTSRGRPTAPPSSALAKASPYSRKSSTRTPWWRIEQAARGLVGELDLAVAVDGEQGGRRVVEHRLVEAVGVDQFVALVAQLADRVVEHLGEIAEAAALAAVGEALAEIAEADRVDEAGQLHVGALDIAPEHRRGADDEQGRRRSARRRDRAGPARRRRRRRVRAAAPAARPGRAGSGCGSAASPSSSPDGGGLAVEGA